MRPVPTLSGLVLAGGRSTRMGRDKALLDYRGQPLAARAARVLSALCDEVLVASGDGRRLAALGWPQVADAVPGAGPLGGLVAGLEAAAHPLVAVVATDMPAASAAVLRLLASLWTGEPAVVPHADGRLQPLHALWAKAAAPALRARLAAGRYSLQDALTALDVRVVQPAQWTLADPVGGFAANLNRPEDLDRLPRIPPPSPL